MKLSIITINYNNASGLEKTFSSVFSQTIQGYEYIVIDGGSNDGSVEVILNSSSNLTYWVSEADNGIYNAMNKGISKATGEYILFLNSGDIFFDNFTLANLCSFKPQADIVFGDLVVVEEDKQWIKKYPNKLSFKFFFRDTLPHPSSFIKKELFERFGYYNENNKIVSDWEFFVVVISKYNSSYQHIDLPISKFRTDGISSNISNHALLLQEKRAVLERNFPSFIDDYEELFTLNQKVQTLQNSRVLKLTKTIRSFLKV